MWFCLLWAQDIFIRIWNCHESSEIYQRIPVASQIHIPYDVTMFNNHMGYYISNKCLLLKGTEHHKCLWSWKSSLHSQPLLTFLHSLQWPLDYGGTQHLGSQHLRTQYFRNSQHFRNRWTKMEGMGTFNSDDHCIYYCGQESPKRNGVALTVNKRVQNAVLGSSLKNHRIFWVGFQGKPLNITVIQVNAPTNAKGVEVEWFYGYQ